MSQMAPLSKEQSRIETSRAQAAAADPNSSAWVSANAGTGKTHVLANRVTRLLLNGTEPARILCLTYTKAAAAEMSKRVYDRLATWVTLSDFDLKKDIAALTGAEPDVGLQARARTLFTSAIETPGGLKVQTIHAFAERLLQRFPLEAGVPPGFRILDDAKQRELVSRATDGVLQEAANEPHSARAAALATVIRYAADANFDDLLRKAIAERGWLLTASRIEEGTSRDPFAGAARLLRQALDVRPAATTQSIETERAKVLSTAEMQLLRDHSAGGSTNDLKAAEALSRALACEAPAQRAEALQKYFLTGQGEARDALMTRPLAEAQMDLAQLAERAQRTFERLTGELKALHCIEASVALYRLAGNVLQRYSDAKAAAGALDFDDLIQRTASLFATSQSAEWVLYKLDGGLDHVLVDEAQDTSPEQWEIVAALVREFFAGAGSRDGEERTVFAVGDEKQSIYSFQGAAPEKFRAAGQQFSSLAAEAQKPWQSVPLQLSFRSVEAVLAAVDGVFSDGQRTPGVAAREETIRHIAERAGHAGRVEIWETETAADDAGSDPWEPLSDAGERSPSYRVAERIAATIDGWLRNGEKLVSAGRPIRAGDVLILVRKRHPFALPMVAALKRRGIAVAASDRVELTEQVAVRDLMVLGDFLTLPEDDLALATVLKSPMFGFDDDDLLTMACGRKGSLWKALLAHAKTNRRFVSAADALRRWRAQADYTPPFEFYSNLLDRDGARSKFLHRLGPEAADALDEFLELAIGYDDGAPPSLTGFLASLRQSGHEVKRDMEQGRNEVRVMTVHGAKGLEAPIVFLPDTCSARSGESPTQKLVRLEGVPRPSGVAAPIVWAVKGSGRIPAIAEASHAAAEKDAEERNRLLYVAMTRARDRLYIAGFEGARGREAGCWYELMETALANKLTTFEEEGSKIRRLDCPQTEPPHEKSSRDAAVPDPEPLPSFALRRAAAEPQLTVPLAPSRLEPYAPDAEGEPQAGGKSEPGETLDRISPIPLASGARFLRGTLTHALLEHLPSLPPARRAEAARGFVAKRGGGLTAKAKESVVNETLAILGHKSFAPFFSESSRAEVPIAAVLPRPSGSGPALKLSGQIDRLAVSASEVFVVDYKTNRPPPVRLENVAPAYLYQLAAYALALHEIYPGKRVRAALLWTDGPRLMEVPLPILQDHIRRLWDLDPASLDAT